MKKVISILLTLAMILALSTAAFAAEDTTLVIESNPVGGTENRAYAGYKLLNLHTSHKEDGHGYTCPVISNPSAEHVDDCYNYAYTLNDKYKTILQNEVFANATDGFWTEIGVAKPAAATGVEPAHILSYFASLTSDGGTHYGTLRAAADRIYRAIAAASPAIAADAPNLKTGTNTDFAQGYWLIADTTAIADGTYDANSLVMLDTKADSQIKLTPKVALPVVEKKVKDIDDSEQANSLTNSWVDSADHDIDNNAFAFKLTGTLPTNLDGYDTYTMTFHDTMAAGLSLVPDSFEIFLYNTKNSADGDNDMDSGTKIYPTNTSADDNYDITLSPADGHSIDVKIKNAKGTLDDLGTKAAGGNAIVVVYKATLNESAKLGADGNPNEVYLEFSNDPYSTGTGRTESDKVVVYTYGLTINKVDSHGHALKGAGFTLYKKSALNSHEYIAVGGELKGADMTEFIWRGLDDGDYKLVETTVPDGYNKMEDRYFTITATHTDGDAPALTEVKSEVMGNGVLSTGMITNEIVNNTGTVLPSTGAKGTMMLIGGGSALAMLAAVFMITRKKMSIYED